MNLFVYKKGRVSLQASLHMIGEEDWVIHLVGGEKPHVGAVAVARVRPSLEDESRISASTSVITAMGHKEDALAREMAETLAKMVKKNVVVLCGIHLSDISKEEIGCVHDGMEQIKDDMARIWRKK